jgi:p-hydroxybenzoate 3-monooxygenase
MVLGNLLLARGIETVVLERTTRAQVQTRARAGFLGANSVRVLTEHGLGAGVLHNGRTHGTCAFRAGGDEFELHYGKRGRGECHTVYPQQHLVTDLVAEYLARGGELRFGVTVTGVDPHTGTVRYRDEHGDGELLGRYVAGCDGSNGVTRHAVPAVRHTRDHGISWLAVLAAAPQSMAAVTYAIHDNGFAGHMARSPEVTRYYLQIPSGDDDPAAWPDERVWAELGTRMHADRFGPLRRGPVTERRIVRLRSDVAESLHHERLFLVGDAGSLISPSAAKGANLAIMAAEVLADAITGGTVADYSRVCLPGSGGRRSSRTG